MMRYTNCPSYGINQYYHAEIIHVKDSYACLFRTMHSQIRLRWHIFNMYSDCIALKLSHATPFSLYMLPNMYIGRMLRKHEYYMVLNKPQ